MSTIKEMLLTAPNEQLDPCMFPIIERWSDEPTSLQLLEVIDKCIYASLASGFVVSLLQTLLEVAMERENVTLDDITPLAVWRDRD